MSERRRRILVVDDEEAIVELVAAILRHGPYEVLRAFDGRQGLDAARANHPDLVLLDVAMPELDGFEVCRRLKADPATASIPVLMVTAHTQRDDRARATQLGVAAYVTKPFKPADLLKVIAEALGAD